jgi:hypothetical protein
MRYSKHTFFVLSVAAIISLLILFTAKKDNKKELVYTSRAFPCISGWGYEILVNGKLFIRQESIPVLSGDKGFDEKKQAEQTAQLIINKLKQGRPPTVTTFELQKIIDQYKLHYGQPGKY